MTETMADITTLSHDEFLDVLRRCRAPACDEAVRRLEPLPGLLAALRALVEPVGTRAQFDLCLHQGRAAIAKAEGGAS